VRVESTGEENPGSIKPEKDSPKKKKEKGENQ